MIVPLFLDVDASTLPAELQRLLSTMRELDERSQCKLLLPQLLSYLGDFTNMFKSELGFRTSILLVTTELLNYRVFVLFINFKVDLHS